VTVGIVTPLMQLILIMSASRKTTNPHLYNFIKIMLLTGDPKLNSHT
jgi:hypothetical protein